MRGCLRQPRGPAGTGQLVAQRLIRHALAEVGEEELGRPPGFRVLHRPAGRAGRGDAVDQRDGVVVKGDHALAVELAERDFQPGAGAGDLVDAVELEVAQFADAQPGGAG
jgi:hypothetical protein